MTRDNRSGHGAIGDLGSPTPIFDALSGKTLRAGR